MAQQSYFNKKTDKNNLNFSYTFADTKEQKHQVFFSLPISLVNSSYHEIPSLNLLTKKIHNELPNRAYNLAQQHFQPLEEKYQNHLVQLREFIFNNTAKLGVGFEINLQCPQEFIKYQFALEKEEGLAYTHSIPTRSCSFKSSSTKAYDIMVQQWKALLQMAKNNLPEGFSYELTKTQKGYSSKYTTKWTDSEAKKAKKSLAKMNKMIDKIHKDFENKQKVLHRNYDKLTAFHKKFYEKLRARIDSQLDSLSKMITEKNNAEYSDHYLKIEKKFKNNSEYNLISPDYKKLVIKYADLMQPVANALADNTLSTRQLVEKSLNFLQAIPYSKLQDRDLENFTGFLTAYALLDKNKGDCDSKSVALLALLQALLPDLETIMVLIPKHAFIAVAVPIEAGDKTITYQGRQYVVAEVAGPAIQKLGNLSTLSQKAVKNNSFDKIISFNK